MPTTYTDPIVTSFTLNLRNLVGKFSTIKLPQPDIARDIARALETAAKQFRATTRLCAICGSTLLIGKGHHSKNRLFCSNRCKVRAYRQRKKRQPHEVQS